MVLDVFPFKVDTIVLGLDMQKSKPEVVEIVSFCENLTSILVL